MENKIHVYNVMTYLKDTSSNFVYKLEHILLQSNILIYAYKVANE